METEKLTGIQNEEEKYETRDTKNGTPILTWNDIKYEVKSKDGGTRQLLHSISGSAYPGEVVAIMGPSGAGKTTLFNVISGRVKGGRLYGSIKFNGADRDPHTFKRMLSFVEQDDMMFPSLSVEETLLASARLRLSDQTYTDEEKQQRVSTVLRQLRLSHVKDTMIGGYMQRGVSGGERKRASIGVELVTDPAILMLDEPSSGLDSSSAEMVVSLTKEISRERNLSTLMTIHQPSAEMFAQFDKLILLAQGKLIYMGRASDAVEYFGRLGYQNTNPNPASFLIDLVTSDFSTDETLRASEQRIDELALKFKQSRAEFLEVNPKGSAATIFNEDETSTQRLSPGISNNKAHLSEDALRSLSALNDITEEQAGLVLTEPMPMNRWYREMLVLLKRDWLISVRNRALVAGFLAQSLVSMLFIGFVFFNLGTDAPSIQNRIGAIFAMILFSVFPVAIPTMTLILAGRSILLRERSSGAYRMSSFFTAKSLSIIPLVFGPYFVMYIGIYFIAHLQYDAAKFFIGLTILITVLLNSLAFAFEVAMLVDSMEVAHIITPLVLAMLMLFAGNMANSSSVTPVLRWIKYVCMMYYSYSAMVQNEFTGLSFSCDPGASTCYRSGHEVIESYDLGELAIWKCIVINISMAIASYAIAYILLRWRAKPRYLWI